MSADVTPDLLLHAYAAGVFPMAPSRESDELHWVDPDPRGVLPLAGFRISRSLARRIRQAPFAITADRAFAAVVEGCAAREDTWINAEIFSLYTALHARGTAHSLEVWEGTTLAGGVYGVALGGAFFGESMFSRRRDASKIALATLTRMLLDQGFTLFDTQFLTPHLASLGAVEIARADYRRRLAAALRRPVRFDPVRIPAPQEVVQRRSQTS